MYEKNSAQDLADRANESIAKRLDLKIPQMVEEQKRLELDTVRANVRFTNAQAHELELNNLKKVNHIEITTPEIELPDVNSNSDKAPTHDLYDRKVESYVGIDLLSEYLVIAKLRFAYNEFISLDVYKQNIIGVNTKAISLIMVAESKGAQMTFVDAGFNTQTVTEVASAGKDIEAVIFRKCRKDGVCAVNILEKTDVKRRVEGCDLVHFSTELDESIFVDAIKLAQLARRFKNVGST